MKKILFCSAVLLSVIISCKDQATNTEQAKVSESEISTMNTIFVGTYTKKEGHVDGKAEGIYTVYQDGETGGLEMGKTVAHMTNPSFVKASGDKKNLYAVSELGPADGPAGLLFSYRINSDHSLTALDSISTEGFAPCYIAEDNSGTFVFVANYMGGVVMMYEKNADGSLKKLQNITLENPDSSHPHSVNISADNQLVYITDLGNNRIWIYKLNSENKTLEPHPTPFIQLPEESGPRHFAFSKNQSFGYSINELDGSISAFKIGKKGELNHTRTISSLPEDYTGKNSAADIHVHPSGNYLYASNRGHNSIAAFKVNPETGELKNIEYFSTQGTTPRNFAISPDGTYLYVANQDSDNLVSFKIDPETGKLNFTGEILEIMTPVCVEFLK